MVEDISKYLISLNRSHKILLMIIFDLGLLIASFLGSLYLRLSDVSHVTKYYEYFFFLMPIIGVLVFFKFGLYKTIVRFINLDFSWLILKIVSLYILLFSLIIFISDKDFFPRSILFINFVLLFFGLISSRLFARLIFFNSLGKTNIKRVLIYGAGSAGIKLLNAMLFSSDIKIIGFIDDDERLTGKKIMGIDVFHTNNIQILVSKFNIQEVLLAIPSASRLKKKEILYELDRLNLKVRSIPSLVDLVRGRLNIGDLKIINVDNLLGRETVTPENKLLRKNISNKNVLITGAGGSIGSEISKQVALLGVKKIILIDHSEYALYSISSELESIGGDFEIESILESVLNYKKLSKIMLAHKVDTIFHAAAYKHVPLIEKNIFVGLKNNVFGTLHCVRAAIDSKVSNFVLISTDKAVRPTNFMGASKRVSELIVQSIAEGDVKDINLSIVRFGNVLDSSGSVIPLFNKQISKGGPITVTHKDIVRYFMTIPEAAQLVIQASSMGKSGEVFVLEMGEPVKIFDLAKRMIELSGLTLKDEFNPEGDIEIQFTGLREGEKLFEELLIGEKVSKTAHKRIFKAHEDFLEWKLLNQNLEELKLNIDSENILNIKNILKKLVPGFKPEEK